jgi:hypothetical protein
MTQNQTLEVFIHESTNTIVTKRGCMVIHHNVKNASQREAVLADPEAAHRSRVAIMLAKLA